jgi:hypothetical protein
MDSTLLVPFEEIDNVALFFVDDRQDARRGEVAEIGTFFKVDNALSVFGGTLLK